MSTHVPTALHNLAWDEVPCFDRLTRICPEGTTQGSVCVVPSIIICFANYFRFAQARQRIWANIQSPFLLTISIDTIRIWFFVEFSGGFQGSRFPENELIPLFQRNKIFATGGGKGSNECRKNNEYFGRMD